MFILGELTEKDISLLHDPNYADDFLCRAKKNGYYISDWEDLSHDDMQNLCVQILNAVMHDCRISACLKEKNLLN